MQHRTTPRAVVFGIFVTALSALACGGSKSSRPEPAHCAVEPLTLDFGTMLPPLPGAPALVIHRSVSVSNEILTVTDAGQENLSGSIEIVLHTPAVSPPVIRLEIAGNPTTFTVPAGKTTELPFSATVAAATSPGLHRGALLLGGACDSVSFTVRIEARPEDPPAFLTEWGEHGDGAAALFDPQSLTFDSEGLLYVADPQMDRIQVFRTDGTFVRSLSGTGWDPRSIAVDRSPGTVALPPPVNEVFPATLYYIAETQRNEVRLQDETGRVLKQVGVTKDGRLFDSPWRCLLDPDGLLLVMDRANSRFVTVDAVTVATQAAVASWGVRGSAEGQLLDPVDMEFDGAGALFVLDGGTYLVNRFTREGAFLGRWGGAGSGAGRLQRPAGLGVDAAGNVYVADSDNVRVQKFAPDGAFLTAWSGAPDGPGRMAWPADVAVGTDGRVYVLDRTRAKVLVFAF